MITTELFQAARALSRARGFYAVGVLTLMLAIAASTTVFSLFDHVILRALPFAEPDRLVRIDRVSSQAEYVAMRDRVEGLGAVAAHTAVTELTLSGADRPQRIQAAGISANLFQTLGLGPVKGRGFRTGDDVSGADRSVLISDRFWRERFGAQPDAIGQRLILDGQSFEVIGVMPSDARFPDQAVKVWVPLAINSANPGAFWGSSNLQVIARLSPTTGPEAAQAELEVLAEALRLENPLWTPEAAGYVDSFRVVGLKDHLTGPVATPLATLMVAVVLVLMMACVNLSNLFLARALERHREFAIRASLGAGRARLIKSSLAELIWIVVPAALLGIALAWLLTVQVPAMLPPDVPIPAGIGMDGRVLAFALLATIAAAVISGVVPAMRAARGNTAGALASGRQGGDLKTSRISQALVAVQIALAVVLTISAGLSLKTLAAFGSIDPGFEPSNLVTARLDPVPDPDRGPAAIRSMHEELLERVRALPDIEQAGLTSVAPLEGIGADFTAFDVFRDRQDPGNLPQAHLPHVTSGYLEAMGVGLIEGRLFDTTDRQDSLPVAVVSESLARRYFADGDAIGQRIGQPWSDSWWTVIGVVEDVYYEALDQSGQLAIYRPLAQAPRETVVLAVRSRSDFGVLAPALTSIVSDLDADVAVSRLQTGQQRFAQSTAQPRFYGQLLAAFAASAVLLVVLGIHGMSARLVWRRRREIGIRMAVGATPGRVFSFILGNIMLLTGVGLSVGLAAALLSTRWLEAMLFGVESLDAMTFLMVSGLILVASMLSATFPVQRAIRIRPAQVLGTQ
jgi:putative ABC transport system permease protein